MSGPEEFTCEAHHSARAAVPHCFYCDAVGAWFQCDCVWVREIREGKRRMPKVRMIRGETVIIIDEETAARNTRFRRWPSGPGEVQLAVDGELPRRSDPEYMREYMKDWRRRRRGSNASDDSGS